MKRPPHSLVDRLRLRFPRVQKLIDIKATHPSRPQIDRSRVLAFMHIPKTAGSSLTGALVEALKPRQLVSGFDRILFGSYADFSSFDQAVQKVVFLSPDALPDADLVVGHISHDTLKRRYPTAQFTTVLREPISRLLSLWIFWRGHSDAQLAEWGSWADEVRRARQTLDGFLSAPSLACQNDNQVVRMLLSPHALIPSDGFIDPRHDAVLLAAATARLRGFAYVDILENADFLPEWQAWIGATTPLAKLNETSPLPASLRSPLEQELTPGTLERLSRLSRLDLQLWHDVACWKLTPADAGRLREQTLLRSVARYAPMTVPI